MKTRNLTIVDSGSRVYSFALTKMEDEKGKFNELKVVDVTDEYQKMAELKEIQAKLKAQQENLIELGETITQVTIEKEILNAKVSVHDKLGESLIAAKRYLLTGDGDPNVIKALWSENLKLLEGSSESELIHRKENQLDSILKAANDIGMNVVFDGTIPEDDRTTKILASALHECLTNTIKHADGDTVNVSIDESGKITFTNNGNPPKEKINENGGLKNLRDVAEKNGFKMMIVSSPEFKLILVDQRRITDVI